MADDAEDAGLPIRERIARAIEAEAAKYQEMAYDSRIDIGTRSGASTAAYHYRKAALIARATPDAAPGGRADPATGRPSSPSPPESEAAASLGDFFWAILHGGPLPDRFAVTGYRRDHAGPPSGPPKYDLDAINRENFRGLMKPYLDATLKRVEEEIVRGVGPGGAGAGDPEPDPVRLTWEDYNR